MSTFLDEIGLIKSSCINADNTVIIGRIWCDRDSINTAPTIDVNSSGDLVATSDATTAATDFYERGGTAGTIDVSDGNADTWQEVDYAVNDTKAWHFHLVGAKGTDSSDGILQDTAETDCGNAGRAFDLLEDTSDVNRYRIGITAKKPGTRDSDIGFINEVLSVRTNVTCSGAIVFYIYEIDDRANTSETRFQYTLTTATEKAFDERQIHIQSQPGNRLLVSVEGASAISAAYLDVRHRTIAVEH